MSSYSMPPQQALRFPELSLFFSPPSLSLDSPFPRLFSWLPQSELGGLGCPQVHAVLCTKGLGPPGRGVSPPPAVLNSEGSSWPAWVSLSILYHIFFKTGETTTYAPVSHEQGSAKVWGGESWRQQLNSRDGVARGREGAGANSLGRTLEASPLRLGDLGWSPGAGIGRI